MNTTTQPTEQNTVSVEYALQRLQERGFKAEIIEAEVTNPDGTKTKRRSVKILHTPPHEKALAAFFADPDAPCDFPGCKEFQRQYKTALEAAGGAACTSCEKGRIMRSMSPNIIKAMGLGLDKTNGSVVQSSQNNEPATVNQNTGTVEVSGSGSESPEGTLVKPSLLRRAAASIKKIFGAGS